MADVVVTLKIMPSSPDVNLDAISSMADGIIKKAGGEVGKTEKEPIAFGLVSLRIIFVINEKLGGTEPIENAISQLKGVASVEAVDVRRAIG